MNIELYKQSVQVFHELHKKYYDFFMENSQGNLKMIVVEGPDKVGKTTYIRNNFSDKEKYYIQKDEVNNYKSNIDFILGFSIIRNTNVESLLKIMSQGKTVVYDRYIYSTIVYNILYKVIMDEKIMSSMVNDIILIEDLMRFVFSMSYYIIPEKIIFMRKRLVQVNLADPYERTYDQDLLLKIYNDIFDSEKMNYIKIEKI